MTEPETIFRSTSAHLTEAQSTSDSIPLRLITHNIRYATTNPFPGEELWTGRRCPRLCNELVFHSASVPATFVCLQEVLHSQLVDIFSSLNEGDEWDYIGVGRDDGKEAGEYSPIFYRPAIWELQTWRTIWLSETPEKASKGWDASSVRIVTVGTFKHTSNGQPVVVMSTHFDDAGLVSRRESAKLILSLVAEYQTSKVGQELIPILLAGDFNSTPDGEAYQIVTDPSSPMADTRELVPEQKRYGNEMTFTSFGTIDNTPSRIDFLFNNKHHLCLFKTYAVLSNRFDDGVYLSDHRAVVADLILLPPECSEASEIE